MINSIYKMALAFKQKYPQTIAWRLKAHSKIAEQYLNPDEKVQYVFVGQKNYLSYEIFMTYLIAITDQRIILAQKRLLFGHFFISITPDMYNDLTIQTGIIWGKVCLDTVKEVIQISNIQKRALPEIQSQVTSFMIEEKKKYGLND